MKRHERVQHIFQLLGKLIVNIKIHTRNKTIGMKSAIDVVGTFA
jgi:hypothetical protein